MAREKEALKIDSSLDDLTLDSKVDYYIEQFAF